MLASPKTWKTDHSRPVGKCVKKSIKVRCGNCVAQLFDIPIEWKSSTPVLLLIDIRNFFQKSLMIILDFAVVYFPPDRFDFFLFFLLFRVWDHFGDIQRTHVPSYLGVVHFFVFLFILAAASFSLELRHELGYSLTDVFSCYLGNVTFSIGEIGMGIAHPLHLSTSPEFSPNNPHRAIGLLIKWNENNMVSSDPFQSNGRGLTRAVEAWAIFNNGFVRYKLRPKPEEEVSALLWSIYTRYAP